MATTLDMRKLTALRHKVQSGAIEERLLQRTGDAINDHVQTHWSASSPSSPGHPPAVVTGELKNSIRVVRMSANHYRVVVMAEHGLYLEFGTSRMAPRPFLSPAVEAVRPQVKGQAKIAVVSVIESV